MHGDTKLQVTGENNGSGPRVRGATSPRGRGAASLLIYTRARSRQ